jgi:hypothetical protein
MAGPWYLRIGNAAVGTTDISNRASAKVLRSYIPSVVQARGEADNARAVAGAELAILCESLQVILTYYQQYGGQNSPGNPGGLLTTGKGSEMAQLDAAIATFQTRYSDAVISLGPTDSSIATAQRALAAAGINAGTLPGYQLAVNGLRPPSLLGEFRGIRATFSTPDWLAALSGSSFFPGTPDPP